MLAVGTAFDPAFAIVQAFIYPFVWTTAPTTRSAITANLLVAVAIVVGYVARSGVAGLLPGLAVAVLSVGFSIALGLWITRIAQYGEERSRLLDELQAAQGQLAAMHRDAGVTEERIAKLAALIEPIDGAVIHLAGHTDVRGTETFNTTLSMARAEAVRDALIRGGMPAERVIVTAVGETGSIALVEDVDGMALDRRVEIDVVDLDSSGRVAEVGN